jgi:uncharacterized protein
MALPRACGAADDRLMDLLEVMTFDECLGVLATKAVGRIALTHRALPVIFPVNYVLDGHSVLMRTAPGTALAAARDEVVVAFEVDDIDERSRAGWSVLVTGFMRELTAAEDVVRATQRNLVSWVGDDRSHFVRITPARITGRRIAPAGGSASQVA